ncbi:MAG TPA: hypothetical protein VHV30_16900 [Polyangiaceae bacterium]|nr:hypothetical protein [Polyangiaceae bacterium]
MSIVDVDIRDEKSPATFDIKIRNTSHEVCFVKRIDLDVLNVAILPVWYRPKLQQVTAIYDADFDPREPAPYVLEVPVSQSIEPEGVDRFELRLRYPP